MKDTIAHNSTPQPILIIDNDLDEKILYPEKLKETKEHLANQPIPAEIYLQRFTKEEQEHGFLVSGIVKQADAEKNTFQILSNVNQSELQYKISTVSTILNSIVKKYWRKPIKVHILPKINNDKYFEYELVKISA
jgi:hypothetical protein